MKNSRDVGLNHGAGKGDADRSDRKKFAKRFPTALTGNVPGFQLRGRRLVKVYGKEGTELRTRTVSRGSKISQADLSKVSSDFAQAQQMADEQNAKFRAQGFDTLGH